MWELYALWSLVGCSSSPAAAGARPTPPSSRSRRWRRRVGCAGGGSLSRRIGERRVALAALVASARLLRALRVRVRAAAPRRSYAFLVVWGIVAVADSPQFSALAARYCPPEYTATALTVQNGIGFAVTVVVAPAAAAAGDAARLALGLHRARDRSLAGCRVHGAPGPDRALTAARAYGRGHTIVVAPAEDLSPMKNWTLAFLLLVTAADPARAGSREDDLLQAVRTGDAAAVKALLDQGVPVDTKFRYDRTRAVVRRGPRERRDREAAARARGRTSTRRTRFYHRRPRSAGRPTRATSRW